MMGQSKMGTASAAKQEPAGCTGRTAERGCSALEVPWPGAAPPWPSLQHEQPPREGGFLQR